MVRWLSTVLSCSLPQSCSGLHDIDAWTHTAQDERQKGTCFCWSQMQILAQEVFRYFSFRQKHVSRFRGLDLPDLGAGAVAWVCRCEHLKTR